MDIKSKSINHIPVEFTSLIPEYNGDKRTLNFYIRKCDYVNNLFAEELNSEQDLYIFHVFSSKLVGQIAQLCLNFTSWDELRKFLIQVIGNPYSANYISKEIESLQINYNESYLDFFYRIQLIKNRLIEKTNIILNANERRSKIKIYTQSALNVFLFNLPIDLVRIVRMNGCSTIEQALSLVVAELNA